MSSVTARISAVKQPTGGYIKPSQFEAHKIDDGQVLNEAENVHASIMGMVVDYLTRFMMGTDVVEAFSISCKGAMIAEQMFKQTGTIKKADKFLSNIKGLDDTSIISACKMVTYDVWFRNPIGAMMAKGADDTNPDADTIQNVKIMVERSMAFWKEYGPVVKDGFTFEPNGYTATVDSGDGDYLTADTLWDFKVTKSKPSSKHTLQLLMYWIMGQHSGQEIYKGIKKLGIFNPRLNVVYLMDINKVSAEVIAEVERDIICY